MKVRQRRQTATTGTTCELCGWDMPIDADGRCPLGHRVVAAAGTIAPVAEVATEPEMVAVPAAEIAPPPPAPDADAATGMYDHPYDDVLAWEDVLLSTPSVLDVSEPAPPPAPRQTGHAPSAASDRPREVVFDLSEDDEEDRRIERRQALAKFGGTILAGAVVAASVALGL